LRFFFTKSTRSYPGATLEHSRSYPVALPLLPCSDAFTFFTKFTHSYPVAISNSRFYQVQPQLPCSGRRTPTKTNK